MLSKESAEFFINQLLDLKNNQQPVKDNLFRLKVLYKDIINTSLEKENQFFSSQYAKSVYLSDRLAFPVELHQDLKKFHYFIKKVKMCDDYNYKADEVIAGIIILLRLQSHIAGIRFDYNDHFSEEELKYSLADFSKKSQKTTIVFLKATIKRKGDYIYGRENQGDYSELIIESPGQDEIRLLLYGIWTDLWTSAWKGATLNIHNVKVNKDNPGTLITGSNTLIVLEPDYLIDATEIAECFHSSGVNIYMYFLRKFINKGTGFPLVMGNIVNHFFDELISNPSTDLESALAGAFKARPLQAFSLALNHPEQSRQLRKMAALHFASLKEIISSFEYDHISIEPTFLSPAFGLQGRLDALLEYDDEKNRKTVIELKSGKAPSKDLSFRTKDGKFVRSGIWNNHLAQTTAYNMLLDSAYKDRTGSSQILYSKAEEYPLRNAPNIIMKKRELTYYRNWIISLERALMSGVYSLFSSFNNSGFGTRPPFINSEIETFDRIYSNLDDTEKDYFHSYVSFILRELYSDKIGFGTKNDKGFSSLWRNSIHEKTDSNSIISDLEIEADKCDFNNMHLCFRKTGNTSYSLRPGDIAVLYPADHVEEQSVVKQQIIKCSIKEIDSIYLWVSLRNKQFNRSWLNDYNKWALEADYIDSTNKKLFTSIFLLLGCNKRKKDIILGRERPAFKESVNSSCPELNLKQQELLEKALKAEDYFILQGPPGTGKTSYMLRYIIENIFNSCSGNILVLAYTNRAVDEICSSILKIDENFPFLRLGSKDSSLYRDWQISCLSDKIPLRELYERLLSTRVIVSTVSSVLYNPEILEIKKFDVAVIDEASQILEPQIVGILSQVDRFIMIGDEKQLPAVVVQGESGNTNTSDNLKEISLSDLRNSLFERLLKCCVDNNWDDAYGMLDSQARMHNDIMDITNGLFYNNKLRCFDANIWQKSEIDRFKVDAEDPLERLLAKSRTIFIPSKVERKAKINKWEAGLTVELINTIRRQYGDQFSVDTVGVISPFRAQCTEIKSRLTKDLRELVSVETVERFQGSERDIIIMSFAVNYEYLLKSIISPVIIGENEIDRKLNVTITRAKKAIVLIGASEILSKDRIYSKLIDKIKSTNGFISLSESEINNQIKKNIVEG